MRNPIWSLETYVDIIADLLQGMLICLIFVAIMGGLVFLVYLASQYFQVEGEKCTRCGGSGTEPAASGGKKTS